MMHSLHYTLLARGTRSQLAHLHHRLNLRVKIADDARLVELLYEAEYALVRVRAWRRRSLFGPLLSLLRFDKGFLLRSLDRAKINALGPRL